MTRLTPPYVLSATCIVALTVASLSTPAFAKSAKNAPQNAAPSVAAAQAELEPMESLPGPDVTQASPAATGGSALPNEAEPPVEPLKAKAVVVDIDSKQLNYDKEKDNYVATGDVHVVISEQNSELIADKVIYDPNQNLVVAEGRVVIIKNGKKTDGTYAKIDLTRESALISDPVTMVNQVRVKAKQAHVDPKFIELENGKLIINQAMLAKKASQATSGTVRATAQDDESLSRLAYGHSFKGDTSLDAQSLDLNSEQETEQKGFMGKFKMKVKEVEVTRGEDGYDDIDLKWPSLYWGNFKLATMPHADFSYDENTKDVEYLGPDIGYDPDLGGLYAGPGWDFRLGKGSVRISPLATFGGGGRRRQRGQVFDETGIGPGAGALLHYRSHTTNVDFGITSKVGQPVLFAERKLFDGKTRVMMGMNEDYTNGFFGYERPRYIAQIRDTRKIGEWKNLALSTFASAGVAHDEYFPTNEATFFVDAKDSKPLTAGRMQLQAHIQNVRPLLQVKDFLSFGYEGDLALNGYTTGDFLGIFRAGPTMQMKFGNRLSTNVRYFLATTAGESPFVFDSYYRGRQNLTFSNAFRVNDFLTVGTRNDLNLMRDNAKGALNVGNQLFVVMGPKDVKLNLAYDFIRKRSYFGINFFPGGGNTAVDFEKMRILQPEHYSASGQAP